MDFHKWIGPIGASLTAAGLIAAIILSPPIYFTIVLISLLGFFLIIMAIQLVSLMSRFDQHFESVANLVQLANRFVLGAALAKKRWDNELLNTPYTLHDLDVELIYQDDNGHRVSMIKEQKVMTHHSGIKELWDRNLKADPDGSFDWGSAVSKPGKIDMTRRKQIGTVYAVPTVFNKELPLGTIYKRKFEIDFIDCFKKDTEDLVFTSERPIKSVTITIQGTKDMEFIDIWGEIRFGSYTLTPSNKPEPRSTNEIVWTINEPQVAEIYRLVWTRRMKNAAHP